MASQEVPFVQTVESRLRELLPLAHDIKIRHGVASLYDCKAEAEYVELQERLRNIFTHADSVNGSSTDASADEAAPSTPSAPAPAPGPSAFQQTSLEAAARNLLYSLLSRYSIDSPAFDAVWNLLDLLIMCTSPSGVDGTKPPTCDSSLPLWLIEELFDSQTIVGCRRIFDYLESSWHFLLHASGTDKGGGISNNTKMILLRTCNELLRRLSRAEDAVFCGRIFMFLFGSFPLGDKSSVNLRGDFHTENTTVFDSVKPAKSDEMDPDAGVAEEKQQDEQGEQAMEGVQAEQHSSGQEPTQNTGEAEQDKMEVDADSKREQTAAATNGDKPDEQKPVEGEEQQKKREDSAAEAGVSTEAKNAETEEEVDTDTFYTIFWSLQHVFSNPTKLFEQEEFQKFQKGLELTIQKFKATPKVLQTHETPRTPAEGKRGVKRRRSRIDDDLASNFNPKYLTSRDLFELELSDMTFQRHILVQALILIDFLLSLTPKAKKKLTELKAQRAMLYNFTLSDEDTKWAASIRTKVASYLQDGPDGKFYYRMADTVLARDKNWVRWKVEACPPIEKSPMPTKDVLEARTGARRACAARRMKADPDGAVDIDFLSDWDNVNHLGTLKDTGQVAAPDEDIYLREIDTVDLDLEMATEEEMPYLLESKASATWRTLRLVSKRRLYMFDRIDEADGLKSLAEPEMPPESEEPGVPEQQLEEPGKLEHQEYTEESVQSDLSDGAEHVVAEHPDELETPEALQEFAQTDEFENSPTAELDDTEDTGFTEAIVEEEDGDGFAQTEMIDMSEAQEQSADQLSAEATPYQEDYEEGEYDERVGDEEEEEQQQQGEEEGEDDDEEEEEEAAETSAASAEEPSPEGEDEDEADSAVT